MSTEVKVPDIGDFKDVAVIEVLVKPGDSVKVEQSLITIESDKASMEIPSAQAGVVKELKVKIGDKLNEGSVILTLEAAASGTAASPAACPGVCSCAVISSGPLKPAPKPDASRSNASRVVWPAGSLPASLLSRRSAAIGTISTPTTASAASASGTGRA